jgi:hypothetical protein
MENKIRSVRCLGYRQCDENTERNPVTKTPNRNPITEGNEGNQGSRIHNWKRQIFLASVHYAEPFLLRASVVIGIRARAAVSFAAELQIESQSEWRIKKPGYFSASGLF